MRSLGCPYSRCTVRRAGPGAWLPGLTRSRYSPRPRPNRSRRGPRRAPPRRLLACFGAHRRGCCTAGPLFEQTAPAARVRVLFGRSVGGAVCATAARTLRARQHHRLQRCHGSTPAIAGETSSHATRSTAPHRGRGFQSASRREISRCAQRQPLPVHFDAWRSFAALQRRAAWSASVSTHLAFLPEVPSEPPGAIPRFGPRCVAPKVRCPDVMLAARLEPVNGFLTRAACWARPAALGATPSLRSWHGPPIGARECIGVFVPAVTVVRLDPAQLNLRPRLGHAI